MRDALKKVDEPHVIELTHILFAKTIEYSIGIAGPTRLMVYDVLGREVVKLVDEYRPIGSHKVVWNANNMPSGIYFYRLETSSFIRTQKMILMK